MIFKSIVTVKLTNRKCNIVETVPFVKNKKTMDRTPTSWNAVYSEDPQNTNNIGKLEDLWVFITNVNILAIWLNKYYRNLSDLEKRLKVLFKASRSSRIVPTFIFNFLKLKQRKLPQYRLFWLVVVPSLSPSSSSLTGF